MYSRLVLLLVLTMLSDFSVARETKEQKRQHTYNLRRFIQLVEFTMNDESLTGELQQERRQELAQKFQAIQPKLSPKKSRRFQELFQRYQESLTKGSPETMTAYNLLRSETFRLYKVVTAPAQIPDASLGSRVYQQQCAVCHGKTGEGDGAFTRNKRSPMVPLPKSFVKMGQEGVRSPFSYFNTLLIGSESTTMVSFEKVLTTHERWSLAFFLSMKLQFEEELESPKIFTLDDLSRMTNYELLQAFPKEGTRMAWLNYVRNRGSFSKNLSRK